MSSRNRVIGDVMKNIPEGYKKEKNRIIPLDWRFVKIGDILSKVGKRVEVKKDNNYRQIGIRSHGKGLFYKEPVSGEELGNKSVFWIEQDCFIVNIVFAWEQAIGKTTAKERGMICSHRFPMYRPIDNRIDIDYLVYVFKTAYGKKILELASPGGAGRNKTLGQKEFANSEILIPNSIEEQRRIVKIISTWDFAIEKQQQLIEKKKEFKKGLMQRLLSGEVRFKEFKDKWNKAKVSDIANCFAGGTPSTKISQYWGGDNIWLQSGRIQNCRVDKKNDEIYITNEGLNNSSAKLIKEKSVLVALTGATCGNIAYLEFEACANQSVVAIEPNYVVDYLYYSLIHEKNQILSKQNGSAQGGINLSIVKGLLINLPSIEEQKKIAETLNLEDKEIELLEKELEALKLQKKGLMQRLLTGEVRVNVE